LVGTFGEFACMRANEPRNLNIFRFINLRLRFGFHYDASTKSSY
jgi:hypothetical protein